MMRTGQMANMNTETIISTSWLPPSSGDRCPSCGHRVWIRATVRPGTCYPVEGPQAYDWDWKCEECGAHGQWAHGLADPDLARWEQDGGAMSVTETIPHTPGK